MANIRDGDTDKGSRKCLQDYMKNDSKQLSDLIILSNQELLMIDNVDLYWKSPIAELNFLEYRDNFLEPLGLMKFDNEIRQFWPANGLQWDGLAVVTKNNKFYGILLIEAKAHPEEAKNQYCKAQSNESINRIKTSLAFTRETLGIDNKFDDIWFNRHYQFANRLAFMVFLNRELKIPTWLVMVNFVNDFSLKPTDLKE